MHFDFENFLSLWLKVRDLHPSLQALQPIAIVDEKHVYLYEPSEGGYHLRKVWSRPDYLHDNLLSAFPLKENNFKITCVVGFKAVKDLEGMVFILHEFVHCFQFNTVEMELRERLEINKYYMERKKYDWELTHSFPYHNEKIRRLYIDFVNSIISKRYKDVSTIRFRLKELLSKMDYEYMVWQEWKEGFARYIENLIRERMGLKRQIYKSEAPFNRVTFYFGGEELIRYLIGLDPSLENDLVRLFEVMYDVEF